MIKVSYFIRRAPGSSAAQFHDYWRTQHAALIKRHAHRFGIARYVQLHATEDPRNAPSAAFPEPYDGAAELWFSTREGLEEWFRNTSPEAKAAGKEIRDDERKFIDRAHSPFIVGEEEPMI